MDLAEFRQRGEEVIDYIVDYLNSVSERPVISNISPGYLRCLLPSTAPEQGESFDQIMKDFEKFIMPGMTHWQHPQFHASYPINFSYPAILGQMLTSSIGCSGYNYNVSPAGKELEPIVLDCYGKMIGLPDHLLRYAEGSRGGGSLENSCSESVFKCMIAARDEVLQKLDERNPGLSKEVLIATLTAYCSKESPSSVEKASMLAMVSLRVLEVDEDFRLRGEMLDKAIKEDKKRGFVPFFASACLGTTSCCSCDALDEIGPLCAENEIWLHVDASYGGTALICPEYKHLLKGMEYASSFNVNAAKWMLVHVECTALWSRDRFKINNSLVFDKTQLCSSEEDSGYPINKPLRVLKLWFVIRNYGIEGLQEHVRNHVRLAKLFADYVRDDSRFKVLANEFGLVCFRLRGSNSLNKRLLKAINDSYKLYMIGFNLNEEYTMRFFVCSKDAKEEDVTYAWSVILDFTNELLVTERRRFSVF